LRGEAEVDEARIMFSGSASSASSSNGTDSEGEGPAAAGAFGQQRGAGRANGRLSLGMPGVDPNGPGGAATGVGQVSTPAMGGLLVLVSQSATWLGLNGLPCERVLVHACCICDMHARLVGGDDWMVRAQWSGAGMHAPETCPIHHRTLQGAGCNAATTGTGAIYATTSASLE
jgi:hypothetical protein